MAEANPAPPRRWVADLPEILVRLVERAVAKDPSRRFRNAGEMRIALGIVAQVLAGQLAESEGLALLEPAVVGDAEATAILGRASDPGMTVMQPGGKGDPLGREALSRSPTLTRAALLPRRKSRAGPGVTAMPAKTVPADTIPPTQVEGGPSRLPLFLGLGLAVLAAAGGGLWL